ncbi:hypothetical protein H6G18_24305 [Anabaena subtropica FACHB-260]|uniref:Uncharacterized protein n=1 Tax=Anabaena subtropica FACHB-260 TaxID=2692884 RepID=A0ABR8CVK4_9NOST|nr:hypothetical protein [Anabaena subtropica FACHB-260]
MTLINSKSQKNSRTTRQNQKCSHLSSLLYTALSITVILCTYATVQAICPFLIFSLSAASGSSFQSTSIPWLNSKSECEYTRRYWRDNQCWDEEHQPMF